MKAKEIIKNIESNGGLDWSYIINSAKREGITTRDYLYDYIRCGYECHGNTARAVVKYYI